MSKIRIYELARELKLDTNRVIEEARRLGCKVSIPSNSISPDVASKIREKFAAKATQQ